MPTAAASTSPWTLDYSLPPANKVKVVAPPGYTAAAALQSTTKSNQVKPASTRPRPPVDLDELRQQKAWELATAPAKQVPMQAFMMYMSGSGIQIFSIMSVWFLLKQAVAGAMGVQQAFAGFDAAVKPRSSTSSNHADGRTTATATPQSFLQQKVVYVAVALWKIRSMGLLPDSAEDWAPIFGGTWLGTWLLANSTSTLTSTPARLPLEIKVMPAAAAQVVPPPT
ncbi:hypothetical protein C6P46_004646 [Rhodotorula mucilaginosa]|uniref:ER membrane protein complex subunit 4 n=1 Tax=Rhodotorula mucilaginosa TaxID=5537 RepID=A0A9P7B539_RHOMI|nr:hypothetical protein C6P46_004646 [Rhodotorula mucilaginosa]TKA54023.1 hypothetical protein B0A53_03305 [Rhodotorula sp. CCFEE 5036]